MPSRTDLLTRHVAALETAEQRAARALATVYNQARSEIVANLISGWNANAVASPADAERFLRNSGLLSQIDARMRELEGQVGVQLRGIVTSSTEAGIAQIRRELALLPASIRDNFTGTFDQINNRMIERYLFPAVDGVRLATTSTALALRRELSVGVVQGEAFPTLVRRLMSATPTGEGQAVWANGQLSAERMVRRTVIAAENGAKVEAIGEVQAQIPEIKKQWFAAIGVNTTDCCLRAHGQIVANSANFTLVGTPRFADEVPAPPGHWNCRSSVAMYHPLFEEMSPTATMRADAKAELDRRKEVKEKKRAVRRVEKTDGDRLEKLRKRIAGLSDEAGIQELRGLIDRIRAAEDAGDEVLGDRLRDEQRIYNQVLGERRRIENEARRASEAAEQAERERVKAETAKRQADKDAAQALLDRQALGGTRTIADVLEDEFKGVDISTASPEYRRFYDRVAQLVRDQSTLSVTGQFHGMTQDVQFRGFKVGNQEVYWESPFRARDFVIEQAQARRLGVELPPTLANAADKIYFTSQSNSHDAHWKTKYANFTESLATGGDGSIVVYNNRRLDHASYAHEAGHNLATKLYGDTEPPASSKYRKAMKGEEPVSEYAKNSPSEDFAEATSHYITNGSYMKMVAPQRYAVIDKILKDGKE